MSQDELIVVKTSGPLDELARVRGQTSDGREAFVTGGLPDEEVKIDVHHISKPGRIFGAVSSVSSPSNHRVVPECEHFLECGGCDFLHADLSFQHQYKTEQVSKHLGINDDRMLPIIPSPDAFGYRALAKFVVGPKGELGSYKPRSHDVVDMKGCLIHAPVIEQVSQLVRSEYSPNLLLRYVVIRASIEQARVIVTLIVRKDVGQLLNALVEKLSALEEVSQIVMAINDTEGDALFADQSSTVLYDGPTLSENVGGLQQSLRSGAFSQINPAAAEKLYEKVVEFTNPENKTVLDLYCGSGGISRALIQAGASKVHGIEANEQAVEAAKNSHSSTALSFEASSVEDALDQLDEYDSIVVNPPRKGLSDVVVKALNKLEHLELIYVSCNPKSLARDVAQLVREGSRSVEKVVPVDMFPQTRHVETIVRIA